MKPPTPFQIESDEFALRFLRLQENMVNGEALDGEPQPAAELLIHVPTQVGDRIDVHQLLSGLKDDLGANPRREAVVLRHSDDDVTERIEGFYRRLDFDVKVADDSFDKRCAMIKILRETLERCPRRLFLVFGGGYGIEFVEDLLAAGVEVTIIAEMRTIHAKYYGIDGVHFISPSTRGWKRRRDRRTRGARRGGEALG